MHTLGDVVLTWSIPNQLHIWETISMNILYSLNIEPQFVLSQSIA